MLTSIPAGPCEIRGISVGGVYMSLHVPALGALLDVVPLKSAAAVDRIFLSHAHPDHAAALPALLGIRRLLGKSSAPRIFAPVESANALRDVLAAASRLHRTPLEADVVPMSPGDEQPLGHALHVRALRTHHGIRLRHARTRGRGRGAAARSTRWRADARVRRRANEWLHLPVHEVHASRDEGMHLEVLLNERDGEDWVFRRDARVRLPLCGSGWRRPGHGEGQDGRPLPLPSHTGSGLSSPGSSRFRPRPFHRAKRAG